MRSETWKIALKVLVVEDDELTRTLVTGLLRKSGYETVEAEDGEEALALLRRQRFDVMVTDLQMPRMGGLEAARRIRRGPARTAGLPIVAMTAWDVARSECLGAGIDELLSKPVTSGLLRRAIETAIVRRRDAPAR